MKLVNTVLRGATFGYVIFAVGLWALDYFQIDISPLTAWLGLPADFLGATGIASGVGLTIYQVLRTTQLTLNNTTQQAVGTVNQTVISVLDKMTTIQAEAQLKDQHTSQALNRANVLLESIVEFEKLLAEKNKQSRLLNDDSKHELDVWIKKTQIKLDELKKEV
jgi:hypothetical protein